MDDGLSKRLPTGLNPIDTTAGRKKDAEAQASWILELKLQDLKGSHMWSHEEATQETGGSMAEACVRVSLTKQRCFP